MENTVKYLYEVKGVYRSPTRKHEPNSCYVVARDASSAAEVFEKKLKSVRVTSVIQKGSSAIWMD